MEKFRFDKVFYTAVDPAEVSDLLEGIFDTDINDNYHMPLCYNYVIVTG